MKWEMFYKYASWVIQDAWVIATLIFLGDSKMLG